MAISWMNGKFVRLLLSLRHHCVDNYRPISLLCILLKVLESIIYKKVIPFLRSLLCRKQFGILSNCSAVSQLLSSFSVIM